MVCRFVTIGYTLMPNVTYSDPKVTYSDLLVGKIVVLVSGTIFLSTSSCVKLLVFVVISVGKTWQLVY